MKNDYNSMTFSELWAEIEKRFGDDAEYIFQDKEKLRKAFDEDDGLLTEHLRRISLGQ